jgi:hypothetical protein
MLRFPVRIALQLPPQGATPTRSLRERTAHLGWWLYSGRMLQPRSIDGPVPLSPRDGWLGPPLSPPPDPSLRRGHSFPTGEAGVHAPCKSHSLWMLVTRAWAFGPHAPKGPGCGVASTPRPPPSRPRQVRGAPPNLKVRGGVHACVGACVRGGVRACCACLPPLQGASPASTSPMSDLGHMGGISPAVSWPRADWGGEAGWTADE